MLGRVCVMERESCCLIFWTDENSNERSEEKKKKLPTVASENWDKKEIRIMKYFTVKHKNLFISYDKPGKKKGCCIGM